MPKVLVVDDATGVHDMLRTLFATMDLEDAYAHSGAEALKIYEGGDIDVVLSDVRMEQMDGIVLLRRLKKMDPNAVVIMMTALDRKDDILAALKLGAFDFFIKPFLVNEFKESLRRAFDERRRRLAPVLGQAQPPVMKAAGVIETEKLRQLRQKLEESETSLAAREADLLDREAELEEREVEAAAELQRYEAQRKQIEQREAELAALEKDLTSRAQSTPAWAGTGGDDEEAAPAVDPHLVEELQSQLADLRDMLAEREREIQELHQAGGAAAESNDWAAADLLGFGDDEEMDSGPVTDESLLAREAALREREELLAEREAFLEQSENALFDKGQQLQELETELEHRRDQIEYREQNGGGGGGISAEDQAEIMRIKEDIETRARELAEREHRLKERERDIKKAEALIKAREQYLRASESILFNSDD
ncbi:MAG: response regulator [Verrucomicrobiota bacterium JB022]|nr:response regulator [Verrucomicrobiota bacterium JB022]